MKRACWLVLIGMFLASSGFAQERVKFPVGVSSKVLGYGTLWAAWRRGYFEREGLDVDVVLMRGTAPAVQALIANSISAALLANDGPITAVEQGADLVMVASGSKLTHMLIGAKNYRTYEDLRGSTIGSSTLTSGTTFVLRRALKLKGLEYPRDYKLLSVGGTTPAFLAMNAGQTAASMMAVPYSFQAQDLGFNLIGRMVDVFPNYLLSAFSVRRSWAEKNRPLVVRFLKASGAGEKMVRAGPQSGDRVLGERVSTDTGFGGERFGLLSRRAGLASGIRNRDGRPKNCGRHLCRTE